MLSIRNYLFIILSYYTIFIYMNFANAALPDMKNYIFYPQDNKMLPGNSAEANQGDNCDGIIKEEDQIAKLAIAASFYINGCYTNGRYNHNEYMVIKGVLTPSAAIESNAQIEAYQIYEPAHKATNMLGSIHMVYYKFPTKQAYGVYQFNNGQTQKLGVISAEQIIPNNFTKISQLPISALTNSVIYFFVPEDASAQSTATIVTASSSQVTSKKIKSTLLGDLLSYSYPVNGAPFNSFSSSAQQGANSAAQTRQFFLVRKVSGQLGIVWQDQTNGIIRVTWLGDNLQTPNTIDLPNHQANVKLAAAIHDNQGNLYYLIIQSGDGSSTEAARTAYFYKVGEQGNLLLQQPLDTSVYGMNIINFSDYVASLHYANNKLGLILARIMHQSSDGLHHQGAIAVVINSNTLLIEKNWGQTSGHSFDSFLTANTQDKFVGIDLGDNYPRGIHLHQFTSSQMDHRVVYTFKTRHGTTPQSPAGVTFPIYSEISSNGINYYRWSNDNNTYTELGGVVPSTNGYTVIFAGEISPNGKSLDNSRTGNSLNDPRNICMIQVHPEFNKIPTSNTNEVSDSLILTKSPSETGGFYTFDGEWTPQRNTGVVCLTNYQDKNKENATRIKTTKLSDGNIMILWEKWNASAYVNTYAMKITENGNKLTDPIELGTQVRFNRRDDVLTINSNVYWATSDTSGKKLELVVLAQNGTLLSEPTMAQPYTGNQSSPSSTATDTINTSSSGQETAIDTESGSGCSVVKRTITPPIDPLIPIILFMWWYIRFSLRHKTTSTI